MNFFKIWLGTDYVFYTWGEDDKIVLYKNCNCYNFDTDWIGDFIDIQKEFSKRVGYNNKISLKNAIKMLNINCDMKFHRALNDVIYTAKIVEKMKTNNENLVIEYISEVKEQSKKENNICNTQRKPNAHCPQCGKFSNRISGGWKTSNRFNGQYMCKKCKIIFTMYYWIDTNEFKYKITRRI